MFNKFWNKIVNNKNLYTEEQIDEVKEQINAIENKIESMKQVIDAYMTSDCKNETRIVANQNAIEEKEKEKNALLIKLSDMEDKNVNRKRS